MTGIQDDEVFDAADNAPITADADFPLIARVKPPVSHHFGGFLGTIPIACEKIRSPDENLFTFADAHFDPVHRLPNVSRLDRNAGIIKRANAGGLREAVTLHHRNP